MSEPLVSVIIPAHNGGELLGEAIRSVLSQTHERLELLVVDDASLDDTADVVAEHRDERLRYIKHETNRGPDAARRTGLEASAGTIVAFLDQDDLFHPKKLETHVEFFRRHAEVGLTYNPLFVVAHPTGLVLEIRRAPASVGLADLVLGFPISPSAVVVRREWILREALWDESTFMRGREIVMFGRLLLDGCRFANVDRVLNYRRIHLGRRYGDLETKCLEERRCQEIMLADPRCPREVRALASKAAAGNCLGYAVVALAEGETAAGQQLLREAVRLDPCLAAAEQSRFPEAVVGYVLLHALDSEAEVRSIFAQLPPELSPLGAHLEWAVSQTYLIRGTQELLWGAPGRGRTHLEQCRKRGVVPDENFLRRIAYELWSYGSEFGRLAAQEKLREYCAAMAALGGGIGRRLKGLYYLGHAFSVFADGPRKDVPAAVLRAFLEDPASLSNRGAWSLLLRSASPRSWW